MCEIYSEHWVHKHTANFENIVSVISCLSDSWLKNKQIIYFSLPTALSEMVHWKHVVDWVSSPSWPVTLSACSPVAGPTCPKWKRKEDAVVRWRQCTAAPMMPGTGGSYARPSASGLVCLPASLWCYVGLVLTPPSTPPPADPYQV